MQGPEPEKGYISGIAEENSKLTSGESAVDRPAIKAEAKLLTEEKTMNKSLFRVGNFDVTTGHAVFAAGGLVLGLILGK